MATQESGEVVEAEEELRGCLWELELEGHPAGKQSRLVKVTRVHAEPCVRSAVRSSASVLLP